MAKKQTRRTISVSKKTFERAKEFAAAQGRPLSQLAEASLLDAIDTFPVSSKTLKDATAFAVAQGMTIDAFVAHAIETFDHAHQAGQLLRINGQMLEGTLRVLGQQSSHLHEEVTTLTIDNTTLRKELEDARADKMDRDRRTEDMT